MPMECCLLLCIAKYFICLFHANHHIFTNKSFSIFAKEFLQLNILVLVVVLAVAEKLMLLHKNVKMTPTRIGLNKYVFLDSIIELNFIVFI